MELSEEEIGAEEWLGEADDTITGEVEQFQVIESSECPILNILDLIIF